MADTSKDQKTCPDCGVPVRFRESENSLTTRGLDGRPHRCYTQKPIGQAVEGRLIESLRVRRRRVEITLDGGVVLYIRGAEMGTGTPPVMKMELVGLPGGTLEE